MKNFLNKVFKKEAKVVSNPFQSTFQSLKLSSGATYNYYSLNELSDSRTSSLPYSIRVLLECAVRNCDEFKIKSNHVERILNWQNTSKDSLEIPFKPARVVLQDFTGVPSVVDLAAMRDALARLKGDPSKINPQVPVELVVDHSIQTDFSRVSNAVELNEAKEFERNYERFEFLKWGQKAFDNLLIIPPGNGIVHQVNLEYLARVAFADPNNTVYPDSLVGADSHTTMINGLGVTGWGVGGIEAENVMLGEPISMVLPEVVGFKLVGKLNEYVTATDLVLTITQMLRKRGVVGKFVEFFGPGVKDLSLPNRATIANMAPEYGATMGYFPVDHNSLEYLVQTGRKPEQVELVKEYFTKQGLFKTYEPSQKEPVYSGDIMELDISTVEHCLSGPKRPHDRVLLKDMHGYWKDCLKGPRGFKGFNLPNDKLNHSEAFKFQGKEYKLSHGDIVIASITSCTNTSNPDSILMAGLLAKKVVEKGLNVLPYIKTTLNPGSKVVTEYLKATGLLEPLEKLGFNIGGYGCTTCIGNTGDLHEEIANSITKGDLVTSAVLSGNRNFEARIHPLIKANFLASPPLVIAYAIAGTVDIDFEKTPLAHSNGKPVFLKDIWPSHKEVDEYIAKYFSSEMYTNVYSTAQKGSDNWRKLEVEKSKQYHWKESTYIHNPPFFQKTELEPSPIKNIQNAYCLLSLGDFITTDHISPAGNIAENSSAGRYLKAKNVEKINFNTYGSRRGNDEVMARGTFANTRISNALMGGKIGPYTIHIPTNQEMFVFDAAMEYQKANQDIIVIAGHEYGSGSSRDWAAKGPALLAVRTVIAESFERIHRSNLVGMGILPLQFLEPKDSLNLTGKEQFSIDLNGGNLKPKQVIDVKMNDGKTFQAKVRLDTDVEVEYYKHGGILQYVLRMLAQN